MMSDRRDRCPDYDGPHQWTTVTIQNGAWDVKAIERCTECGDLRIDETVEVTEVITDDE